MKGFRRILSLKETNNRFSPLPPSPPKSSIWGGTYLFPSHLYNVRSRMKLSLTRGIEVLIQALRFGASARPLNTQSINGERDFLSPRVGRRRTATYSCCLLAFKYGWNPRETLRITDTNASSHITDVCQVGLEASISVLHICPSPAQQFLQNLKPEATRSDVC